MKNLTHQERRGIYDRTAGQCHLCHRKLAFKNYGSIGTRGAWEIDHSIPVARGGSDHGRNLFAACVSCNRSKRDGSTRAARAANGVRRAPLSRDAAQSARQQNTILGAGLGALAGSLAGPGGWLVGALVGSALGNNVDPNED